MNAPIDAGDSLIPAAPDPARARLIYQRESERHDRAVDRLFLWLLLAEWAFAIALALVVAPGAAPGRARMTHLQLAILGGGVINALPLWLIARRSGSFATRCAIAVAQSLWSGLLIHLTGGRIETHFHVFVSLAILSFYRDWRVLLPATALIAADQLVRGVYLPETIFGVADDGRWRSLEHLAWVLFEDLFLVLACLRADADVLRDAFREAKMEAAYAVIKSSNRKMERLVIERTAQLADSHEQYRLIAEGTDAVPFSYDMRQRLFLYVGPQAEHLFGWPMGEWRQPGFVDRILPPHESARLRAAVLPEHKGRLQIECQSNAVDGRPLVLRLVTSLRDEGESRIISGLMLDITELRHLEAELRQAQKLESVGRLSSGVAHEINTPVQFVSDSLHFVRDGMRDLFPLLARYRALETAAASGEATPELARALASSREAADFDYLIEHVPRALDRALEGCGRVADIVRSLKEFAHPDQKEMAVVDLNRAVESTLTIARSEYKLVADVELRLAEIPRVCCFAGEVNQVLLNIVVNAAHAIAEVVGDSGKRGRIRVETARDGEQVVIPIGDTGGGIAPEIRERIFDPFFTTKEVGRGTGQGLAIARSVVQDKHGGSLSFKTEMGVGTTFIIRLPIDGKRLGWRA